VRLFRLYTLIFVAELSVLAAQQGSSTPREFGSLSNPASVSPPVEQALSAVMLARDETRRNPDSPSAQVKLGEALELAGDSDAAEAAFDTAIRLDAKFAPAWYEKGLIAAQHQVWSEAADDFRRALASDRTSALAHLELGEMLLRSGAFEQAANELQIVLKIDPSQPGAHYGLGLIHLQQGNFAAAETDFRKALQYDAALRGRQQSGPSLPSIDARPRRPTGASQKKAAEPLRPGYADAIEGLAEVLLRERQWQSAASAFQQALAKKPDSVAALAGYATAVARLGDQVRARQLFEREQQAQRAELQLRRVQGENDRGLRQWYAGDLAGAAAAFRSALALDPNYAEAHNNLGGVLWQQGNHAEASAHFEAAARLRPDFADAQNNLGNALAAAGRNDEAIVHFREALTARPGFVMAHCNLARALETNQLFPDSEKELREALVLQPDYAPAHVQLGLLLMARAGRLTPEASEEIKRGLSLDRRLKAMVPATVASQLSP
jgi:tetratricopeptide (TPR) repeat protein